MACEAAQARTGERKGDRDCGAASFNGPANVNLSVCQQVREKRELKVELSLNFYP